MHTDDGNVFENFLCIQVFERIHFLLILHKNAISL